jgi:hypothetical protein
MLESPPHPSGATLRIAQEADLAVLPTELLLGDLEPSVLLAHELVKKGTPRGKLAFGLFSEDPKTVTAVQAAESPDRTPG